MKFRAFPEKNQKNMSDRLASFYKAKIDLAYFFAETRNFLPRAPLERQKDKVPKKNFKKISKIPEFHLSNPLRKSERQTANRKARFKKMTETKAHASAAAEVNEDLIDTLIAISVVAKKLAKNLRQTNENQSESEEMTDE